MGAAEGWSAHVARHFGLDNYVVEAHPAFAKRLEIRGATIAASTIHDLLLITWDDSK